MKRSMLIGSLVGVALMAGSAGAQGRGNSGRVPPGHLPAPGECRIWIDGVPPGQQPAPTDCATAERRRPSNGRVIYGSDASRPGNGKAKGKYKNRDRDRDHRRERDDDRYERDRRDRDDDRYEHDRRDRERHPDGRYPDSRYPDNRYPTDGRTPDGRGSPSRLPEMQVSGGLTGTQSTWLDGRGATQHSYTDRNRDGQPERTTWRNARNQIVQVWIDENGDGRADAVQLYRSGLYATTVR